MAKRGIDTLRFGPLKPVGFDDPRTAKRTKEALENQITSNGNTQYYYLNLIEDYMSLWVIKEELMEDIKNRGVIIKWKNGEKQSGEKKNDSVSEVSKVNAQMLKILTELNLKPTDIPVGADFSGEL